MKLFVLVLVLVIRLVLFVLLTVPLLALVPELVLLPLYAPVLVRELLLWLCACICVVGPS